MQGIFSVAADNVVLNYFEKVWIGLWLLIDQIVYGIMSLVYQVFYMITEVNLFDNSGAIGEITERIYVVFGVVMLFVFAYNILILLANPDKLSGNDNSMTRLIRDTVISIVLVALLPTIFDAMYAVQHRVLETNIIGNIILGGTSIGGQTNDSPRQQVKDAGARVATTIFSTFYHPIKNEGGEEIDYSPADCRNNSSSHSLCETYISAIDNANNSGNPTVFIKNKTLSDNIPKNNMKYMYIISTLCGALAVYLFVSFALDVGLRAVKLAVLQVVAPVPIMLRITKPTGGIFSKWFKEIKETYISLFVRLAIIYFAMFTIDLVISYYDAGSLFEEYGVGMVSILAELVLILSILAFAKEAPKLLKNLTGGAGGIEWNIKKKLNSDTYEYGRRAMGAAGTVGRNLGRGLFNNVFQRNDDGTYSLHNGKSLAKATGRNLRNALRAPIYGAYRGWKNSGGNIENLGQEIKKSSVETTNRIDKHEAFRERAKKNALIGNFPGVGTRFLTRANDLAAAVEAQGGLSNYLGNRINYTTSSVSAEKAGTFRKHHANIVDSELIQNGIKGIKEQSMREEEHVREYYNNQNLALLERQRNLVGTDMEYQSFATKAQNIENEKAMIKKGASKNIKSLIDDRLSFESSYNLKKANYTLESKNLENERKSIIANTSLTESARLEALRRVDQKIAENTQLVNKLESQKVDFETKLKEKVNALTSENLGEYNALAQRLTEVSIKENDLYNTDIGSSEFGLEIRDIMAKKAINKNELASEIKRLGDEKKAAIREAYKKNLTDYSSDIRAYYVNNLREIRSEFSEIPVAAQRIIFKEAGFKDADDPNFNLNEALNEVGKIILDESYTDQNVDRLLGFFKGLKRVENRGPFDYRISRLQDATGGNKDGGKK